MVAIPHIPPEIIIRIIRLSLLPGRPFGRGQLSHICEWSLVSKTWCELAQRELFRCLEIDSSNNASRILAALRRRPVLGSFVKCLTLYIGPTAKPKPLKIRQSLLEMLEISGNLEELHMIRVHDFRFGRILSFQGLRKLHLYHISYSRDYVAHPPHFPLLEELLIGSVGPWARELLRREALPRLRSLRIENLIARGNTIDLTSTTISALLAHLEILSLDSDDWNLSKYASPTLLNTVNILWDVRVFPDRSLRWDSAAPSVGDTIKYKHLRLVLQDPDFSPRGVVRGILVAAAGASKLAGLLANSHKAVRSVESIYLPSALKEGTNGGSLRSICKQLVIAVVFEEVTFVAGIRGISERFWRTMREKNGSWSDVSDRVRK